MVTVDLIKAREAHARYVKAWRDAAEHRGSELFAALAAAQTADHVPDLVEALEQLLSADLRLRQMHVAEEGDGTGLHCRACVAGYDPKTMHLVYCAWPCPTIKVLDGGAT